MSRSRIRETRSITTLVVPVPEAELAVAGLRAAHDPWARRGVPAHVTLLGPFVPAEKVTDEVVERLRILFAHCRPLRFRLVRARRWGDVVYLQPRPARQFRRLTLSLATRWPQTLGAPSNLRRLLDSHLTVGRGLRAHAARDLISELERFLPIEAEVHEAVLLRQLADGRLGTFARFGFGAPPA